MAKEDPMEKIAKMIEEKVNSAFEGRARQEKIASDPWAKLEDLVDRTVEKHFKALNEGIEEGRGESKNEGEEKPKLGILGL